MIGKRERLNDIQKQELLALFSCLIKWVGGEKERKDNQSQEMLIYIHYEFVPMYFHYKLPLCLIFVS